MHLLLSQEEQTWAMRSPEPPHFTHLPLSQNEQTRAIRSAEYEPHLMHLAMLVTRSLSCQRYLHRAYCHRP